MISKFYLSEGAGSLRPYSNGFFPQCRHKLGSSKGDRNIFHPMSRRPKKPLPKIIKSERFQEKISPPSSARLWLKLSCEIAIVREVCKANPHTFLDWDYWMGRPRQTAVAPAVPAVDQVPGAVIGAAVGWVVCSQRTAEKTPAAVWPTADSYSRISLV